MPRTILIPCGAMVLFSLSIAGPCLSEELPSVVMIASRKAEADFDRVAVAMVAQFAGSGTGFDVHWVDDLPDRLPEQETLAAEVATDRNAVAVFWIDLEVSERVYFYLSTEGGNRVLVRRLDGTGREGVADALAMICRSAVDAVLAGGIIGVVPEREEVSTEAPRAVLTDSIVQPEDNYRFLADAAFNMIVTGGETGVVPGALFGLSLLYKNRVRFFLGYSFYRFLRDENQFAQLELKRHPIQAGLALRLQRSRWSVEVGLALVVDPTQRTLLALQDGVSVREPYTKVELFLLPAVRLEMIVKKPLSIFLTIGAQIDLMARSFVLEDGPEFFKEMWRIQPHVHLGACFDLL